ncbi:hypothetical protein LLE49_26570 [Alicyclobacillus tolerans]|uniref:CBO0543 family protein n=1 Tax=Alicyclobacillus tolerans TaxID=90970 RepID=UPI001F1F0F3D|nr:CBO0543 family protein [Alicyclobacillus tolerans]MCF8568291.1 hypothetical protein [Alicyclobacillus tolerans]
MAIAWRFGDWRNWKKYQSTILYFMMCDLLYNFLTYNHPLWYYTTMPVISHVGANLLVMFITYPSALLLYLYHFPNASRFKNKVMYLTAWGLGLSLIEKAYKLAGILNYRNGWNTWWSVGFTFVALILLKMHQTHPLLVYLLSVGSAVVLLMMFHIPV